MSFNISSPSVSANVYNVQATNKVATVDSGNLANKAANQSAFSSYIGQALAQVGIVNPTNTSAPVVSGANEVNAQEKSLGTFIQDMFSILRGRDASQALATSPPQSNLKQAVSQDNESSESSRDSESGNINEAAITAYTGGNTTTVGNLTTNLQSLVKQLNDESRNATNNNSSTIQTLKDDFQSVLDAHGAGANGSTTLGNFLQTLAQNLQGQSPLGIIVNTQA
ncbi:MAG: hypothetical protein PHN45_11130 [Methylococcales bacterium]|nr:hypothetical protein [Methylococcales bacterium]MDD5755288.1 hypothetical protein [Methylococcales bacterium]